MSIVIVCVAIEEIALNGFYLPIILITMKFIVLHDAAGVMRVHSNGTILLAILSILRNDQIEDNYQ